MKKLKGEILPCTLLRYVVAMKNMVNKGLSPEKKKNSFGFCPNYTPHPSYWQHFFLMRTFPGEAKKNKNPYKGGGSHKLPKIVFLVLPKERKAVKCQPLEFYFNYKKSQESNNFKSPGVCNKSWGNIKEVLSNSAFDVLSIFYHLRFCPFCLVAWRWQWRSLPTAFLQDRMF